MNILAGYISSILQDFESYLRTEVDLVEDYIRLDLDDYFSSFITSGLQPVIYTFEELSESVFNFLQPEYEVSSNVIVIEFDEIYRKTKLFVRSGIIPIRFDEKSFLSTIFGFTAHWGL